MSILEFIFRDFWTWLGTFLLLCVLSQFRLFSIDRSTKYECKQLNTEEE